MADISKVKIGNVEYNVKDATARTHIADTAIHVTSSDKTNWSAKYDKPSTGIPKTDLASDVQTSLGKADTAVQDSNYVHTDNNFTSTLKSKLDGIATGAEVNVQSDWNQTSTTADDYIKNKPTIPTVTDTYSGTSSNAMSGKAVKQAIDALDGTISGSAGAAKTLTAFSQTDGKVSATFGNIAITTQQLTHASGIRGTNDVTLAPLISTTRANRLAFLPASQIIIEKTTDGGTTWVDAGVSDAVKLGLFSEQRSSIYIPLIDGVRSLLCGVRVTITGMRYNVPSGTTETQKYNYWNPDYVLSTERYCSLSDMYFWISSATDSISVKVERATGTQAKTNAWSNVFNDSTYYMTGWSGSDNIHFSSGVFGGGTSQTSNYWNYRITFMTRGVNGTDTMATSSNTSQQQISEIRAYGENVWTVANQYMAYDHMYSKDSAQNVTFPAKVTATSLTATSLYGDLSKDKILLNGSKYYESASNYVMNFNNSDIVGLNGMYFVDAADGVGEGIHFYRDSSHWDSIRAYSGNLQFSPNRSNNTAGTWYNVYHTNNKPALADLSGDTTHRLVTDTQISNWDTAYSNSHTHSNKTALDAITSTKMTNWDTAYTNSHTHSNKTALDAITSTKMTNWDNAATNSHTHSNKSALDAITSTKMTNWDTAYSNSHTHSNKSVLDTVTSTVVSNSHTHSNKTALDAITSTKMTNWDTAYSNSHSHTNKSVLDGISSTDVSNWNGKVPSTRTVNNKALSSDIILNTGDIPPISTKTYTGLIGSADNHAGAGFYFGKIQPTGYNDVWAIKYQIEIWAPADVRCHAIADVIIIGSQNTYRSYMAFNGITSTDYRPAYHHLIYCAKEAGITANKGHALGVGLRASWKPIDTSYPRTCIVKLYDQINCTVTLNDTAVKWANWDGTGSTNYNTYYELNFASNGLQETGDSAPEYAYYFSHSYSNILAKAAQYRYCLAVQYDENHMLPLNSVSDNTGTSKAMTTESFDPFGKIIYWGTTTSVAAEAAYGRYYQYQQYTDFNACYTFNCGSTLVANKAVYLVCVPQSDGKVKLHTTPWSQTLPTTEDGYVYIYLGQARTTTNMNLDYKHPIYYYKDGAIRQWTNPRNISDIGLTGNLADGFDDSSHRLVTDLQIDTWNAKSNFSGAYSDLTGKPTIPTTLAQLSGDTTHRVVTDTQINTWTDAYTLPSGGIPFNDLSQTVQDLLTNTSTLFDTEVIINDVYLKRYAAGRLMISKVE